MATRSDLPGQRSSGGIDIAHSSRPGGVPTHVVTAPAAATGAGNMTRLAVYAKPATWDPFAGLGRARKALGKRLSG